MMDGVLQKICLILEQRGLAAIRVGFESEIRDMSMQKEGTRTVLRADPANIEHMEQVSSELSKSNICGVIHLAALKLQSRMGRGHIPFFSNCFGRSRLVLTAKRIG